MTRRAGELGTRPGDRPPEAPAKPVPAGEHDAGSDAGVTPEAHTYAAGGGVTPDAAVGAATPEAGVTADAEPPTAEGDPTGPAGGAQAAAARPRPRWHTVALVAGLTAVVAIPLAAALAAVKSPTWYPSVDLALIEMRVRDVATRYNPVLGAGGRFTAYGEQGNHPGPLPYYALAPVYRLLGSTAWALQGAAASLGLAAAAVGIWLAHRRAGLLGALAATLGYLLLVLIYKPIELLSPWNPNVAMLWWVTLLLALWAVLCRDYAILPVAGFAAALCAQAHVSYLGLAGGLAIVVAVFLAVDVVRNPPLRRQLLRWGLVAALVELVLWAPVAYEQWQPGTGNLTILLESFTDPAEKQIPFGDAWFIVLGQLDLTTLPTAIGSTHGPATWLLLGAWAVSVGAAIWLRRPWLSRLHVITAAAMATSFLAIVRITGVPWWYLMLWGRGTALLAAATAVTTLAVLGATLWARRSAGAAATGPAPEAEPVPATHAEPAPATKAERRAETRRGALALRLAPVTPPPAATRRIAGALGVAIAVTLVAATVDGAGAEDTDPDLSAAIRPLVGPTVAALDADGPRDEDTVVTFTDPVNLGSSGFTLLLALERDGFDTYADETWRAAVGDRRALPPAEADREVHVSVGDTDIELWRSDDRMQELASFDPRTPEQRRHVRDTEEEMVAELQRRGLPALARELETVRLVAVSDPDFPADLARKLHRLSDLPQPVAVFLSADPGSAPEPPAGAEGGQ